MILLRTAANDAAIALRHAELLARHERAGRELASRVRQQEVVGRLSLRALEATPLETLMREAVTVVRQTLESDLCDIFELTKDGESLVMRAGDGWAEDLVGAATMRAGKQSPGGWALGTMEPVVVDVLAVDERFGQRSLLHDHGVVSGAIVVIHDASSAYGVLEAHTTSERVFGIHDVAFMQAIANIVAARIERHEAESQRDRLLESAAQGRTEAENQSRVKSDFLGMLSHELRTPLNAIGGYVQLIEEGIRGPITPEQRGDLARVRRAQRYLLTVIDNVLGFLKFGSGRVRYDINVELLDEVVSAVEEIMHPLFDERSLHYLRRSPVEGVALRADRAKLQQILVNLVSNAIKFTDKGGTVSIEAELTDHTVRIHVRDTGCGIPPDALNSVFEPFVQLERVRARRVDGTGLGLTISREFAKGMGGSLWAESEPGIGSVFTVELPRAD
jgi:signal transduction histidine kinase